MRSFLLLFVLCALITMPFAGRAQTGDNGGAAQNEQNGEQDTLQIGNKGGLFNPVDTIPRAKFGGFANAHAGMTYGTFGDLEKDLKNESVFDNQNYQVHGLGTVIGGSVNFLLFKRLLINAGGTRYAYDASLSKDEIEPQDTSNPEEIQQKNKGEAKVGTNIFHGGAGFVVMNKKQMLLYPYVNYAFGTTTMEVKNYSRDELEYGNTTIDQAESVEYESDVSMLDVGVGFRYRLKQKGSLMLGAELGGYFNLGGGDWTGPDGNTVEDVKESSLAGGYLRITLGGGIFSIAEGKSDKKQARQMEME
jgi:hypothetical protein